MRIFLGLPISAELERIILAQISPWKSRFQSKLSWTKSGNFHLTLKFLGEVPAPRVASIKTKLSQLKFEPFALQVNKANFFYSQGKIRVIYLELQDQTNHLLDLYQNVEEMCSALGFAPEKRKYKPHLTLARVKFFQSNDPWAQFKQTLSEINWPRCLISQLILWESQLTPKGPIYTPLLIKK